MTSKRANAIANNVMQGLKADSSRTTQQARGSGIAVLKRMGWSKVRSPSRQQVQGWAGDISITITYDIRDPYKRIREIIVEDDVTGKRKSVGSVINPARATKLVS
jgi:hypothetical protein